MKKFLKLATALITVLALGSCASGGGTDIKGTYSIYIEGDDWGAVTSKMILALNEELDEVTSTDFTITETKQQTNFADPTFPVVEVTVEREIIDVYFSDATGESVGTSSKYVTIDLESNPTAGSPLLFSMGTQYNTWSDPYYLTIEQSKTANLTIGGKAITTFEIAPQVVGKTTSVDMFKTDSFTATDGVNYQYAYYEPANVSDTLVVWLHGAGEGGTEATDPSVILLANEAGVLGGAEFQQTIGGAHILAPQTPTFWMDKDGSGGMVGAATSYYSESLEELIDDYKEKNDISKVVLIGCSNGGYMTMVLGLRNPGAYTAIIPICEALKDEYITDEQLTGLKDVPMYFIHSRDDGTVDPVIYGDATVKRLQAMGATNLHVSATEHVEDLSGRFNDENGGTYKYNGHWSWIYFFNNESVSDKGIKSWEWLAEQIK
jgi:Predicted peptidase